MRSNLDKLVILLSSGIAQRRLYFADHPKIRGCGQGFTKLLKEILSESRQDTWSAPASPGDSSWISCRNCRAAGSPSTRTPR